MKNNKMLSESQIRRMMQFANLEPLSENFFDKMQEDEEVYEQEGMEEDIPPSDMDDESPVPDMDDEPPMDMDDMGDSPEASGEMEEEIRSLMQTIADAVQDEYGVEVNVDSDDMGEEPPMDDMGEEPPMDDMGEEPPMDDMGEEPPMDDEEAMLEEIFGDSTDSMDVNEEETLEEGANEASESNPGKGMTTMGNNKTQAAPNKTFTENPGEEPSAGGHKLSSAQKPSLPKSKQQTQGKHGDQDTDSKPPMANEVKELKESIAAVVRRMLKEKRSGK